MIVDEDNEWNNVETVVYQLKVSNSECVVSAKMFKLHLKYISADLLFSEPQNIVSDIKSRDTNLPILIFC